MVLGQPWDQSPDRAPRHCPVPSASALQPLGTEVPVNGAVPQPHPVVSLKCPLKDLYLSRCHYEAVSPGPRGLDSRTGPQTPLTGQGTSHASAHTSSAVGRQHREFQAVQGRPLLPGRPVARLGAPGSPEPGPHPPRQKSLPCREAALNIVAVLLHFFKMTTRFLTPLPVHLGSSGRGGRDAAGLATPSHERRRLP